MPISIKAFIYLLMSSVILMSCTEAETTGKTYTGKRKKIAFYETYEVQEIKPVIMQASLECVDIPENSINVMYFENLLTWGEGAQIAYVDSVNFNYVDSVLKTECSTTILPTDLRFLWSEKSFDMGIKDKRHYMLYAIKNPISGPTITNKHIKTSSVGFNYNNSEPSIQIEMTKQGADKWSEMTKNNLGRHIAMSVDGSVYSCPRVDGVITGGYTEISGGLGLDEAKELAAAIGH